MQVKFTYYCIIKSILHDTKYDSVFIKYIFVNLIEHLEISTANTCVGEQKTQLTIEKHGKKISSYTPPQIPHLKHWSEFVLAFWEMFLGETPKAQFNRTNKMTNTTPHTCNQYHFPQIKKTSKLKSGPGESDCQTMSL